MLYASKLLFSSIPFFDFRLINSDNMVAENMNAGRQIIVICLKKPTYMCVICISSLCVCVLKIVQHKLNNYVDTLRIIIESAIKMNAHLKYSGWLLNMCCPKI